MDRRVSIVCSNNSKNCLGRALLLADLLSTTYDVRVVGIRSGAHDWEPGGSFAAPVRSYPLDSSLTFPRAARWLRSEIAGSRVIVCKPKPTSLGLALAAGVRPGRAILDIDDWDVGFGDAPRSRAELARRAPYYLRSLLHPRRLNSYLGVRASFELVRMFPTRLVSNGWLRRRVGGHLLPHVRDCRVFDPARYDPAAIKQDLGLSPRPWVGFIGTVRPHKGIEVLIQSLAALEGAEAPGLLLAGLSEDETGGSGELVRKAATLLGKSRVHVVKRFPFSDLPRYLAVVDVVCIPSLPGTTSAGQIPAKMFDALAMGKPLVVSDAHDTSDVDVDAAVRFRAGSVSDLTNKLQNVCFDADLRRQLVTRARHVALARFDYESGRGVLLPLVELLPPH